MADTDRSVAYFSMEVGLDASIPTYSGGLGILAGDTIRAAADLRVPMVAMTLLHRRGYFTQKLGPGGEQSEEPVKWLIRDHLTMLPPRATVSIEGRTVHLRCWRYDARGAQGFVVPVLFLDADLPENAQKDRGLTDHLYGGDDRYRLCQEVILGIGGVRMLRALGYTRIERFHMNEGHSSLLVLEVLDERLRRSARSEVVEEDVEAVRQQCVFTTHTPVPAGHDQFQMDLVDGVVDHHVLRALPNLCCFEGKLNTTYLALNFSRFVNGVAKRHGEVSQLMFRNYEVDWITNGVHAGTWTCEPMQALFDRYVPGWREDNFSLRYALGIPPGDIWNAHAEAKRCLMAHVEKASGVRMDPEVFTLGFARRAATYKRADLLFDDRERLRHIAQTSGPLQIVYAGKAHPRDQEGKDLIRRVVSHAAALKEDVKIVYLPNYDMTVGKLITSGVDVWLNTPRPPLEASGTSGMKAALNGVPSLSILDGWWIEGCIEGVTGWAIGDDPGAANGADSRASDALSLYSKLVGVVLPAYYQGRARFIDVMRHAIALNGSFFNTHRMVQQYVVKAYFD